MELQSCQYRPTNVWHSNKTEDIIKEELKCARVGYIFALVLRTLELLLTIRTDDDTSKESRSSSWSLRIDSPDHGVATIVWIVLFGMAKRCVWYLGL